MEGSAHRLGDAQRLLLRHPALEAQGDVAALPDQRAPCHAAGLVPLATVPVHVAEVVPAGEPVAAPAVHGDRLDAALDGLDLLDEPLVDRSPELGDEQADTGVRGGG